jgi:hypothetical protein
MTTVTSTWFLDALCLQVGGEEMFFPDKGQSGGEAKGVCAECPVRAECLDYAMRTEDSTVRWGVFGGLSAHERRELAASGWQPGDPLPPVLNAPGRCPDCGKRFLNVDRHRAAIHVYGETA